MSIEVRGLRRDEMATHARLVYESYQEYVTQGRGFLSEPNWWLRSATHDPYYEPEQTRVLLAAGEMVASVTSYAREMYCAGGRARVGAIGSVATHPDHRRRGYVRELLAASREWMAAGGYDASFLFGKEEVYGGSGWRMFSAFELTATVRVPDSELGLSVRQAEFPHDVAALSGIYDDFNAPLTGTFVRSQAYWERRIPGGHLHDHGSEFVVLEERGVPVGYYRSVEPGVVTELGWRRGDPALPVRVVGTIVRQWPAQAQTHFCLCTHELVSALGPYLWAPTMAAYGQRQSAVQLVERYKGLWTYIGPGSRALAPVTGTEALLEFLRTHEYVFWGGVDSF